MYAVRIFDVVALVDAVVGAVVRFAFVDFVDSNCRQNDLIFHFLFVFLFDRLVMHDDGVRLGDSVRDALSPVLVQHLFHSFLDVELHQVLSRYHSDDLVTHVNHYQMTKTESSKDSVAALQRKVFVHFWRRNVYERILRIEKRNDFFKSLSQ